MHFTQTGNELVHVSVEDIPYENINDVFFMFRMGTQKLAETEIAAVECMDQVPYGFHALDQ